MDAQDDTLGIEPNAERHDEPGNEPGTAPRNGPGTEPVSEPGNEPDADPVNERGADAENAPAEGAPTEDSASSAPPAKAPVRKRASRKRVAAPPATPPSTEDSVAPAAPTAPAAPAASAEEAPDSGEPVAAPRRATRKRAARRPATSPFLLPEQTPDDDGAAAEEPGAQEPTAARDGGTDGTPSADTASVNPTSVDPASVDTTSVNPTSVDPASVNPAPGVSATGDEGRDADQVGDVTVAVLTEADAQALLAEGADEGETDDPEARDQEASDEGTPALGGVGTFGLLFQAPDPVRAPRVRRRATRAAGEAVPDAPEEFRTDDVDAPEDDSDDGSADTDTDTDAEVGTDAGTDTDTDASESTRRTRRRRGGRGRRRGDDDSTDSGGDSSDADSSDADDSADSGDAGGDAGSGSEDSGDGSGADDDSTDDEQAPAGRRRTRRRRRSGTATDAEDPPGTITRVREPRRDQATGIRGSTRLEAKKQRRREGREAGRRRTIITEAEFLARRESVERVMVVRQQGDRTQIGVLEDGVLVEHYVSRAEAAQNASMAGNVYLGRVQNVLPSMEAAFVDVGRGRNAVLYAGEVNWDAAGMERSKSRRIEHALSSGQGVLVQVTKDPIGHKGARLTSQISLPGRYLVYVPQGHMTGISRKLPDTERARLKKILREVVPADAGVIVRTAAEGASEAELRADVERLTGIWENIQRKAKSANPPSLLHGEADLTVKVIRDVFNEDFARLVVAGQEAYRTVEDYLVSVAPDLQPRLEKWTGEGDVFAAHRIDEQLAKAMDRKVWLPSGGSLVIDRTEAMTVIDVNTGKFIGSGGNLEETVTKNNIEAAEEIVRQLRLRDIGGIIVIDFIDMVLEANRDLVVRRLLECLGRDRTKHQVAEVTSLGLVQMTRKRVGAGLIEVFSEPCEHCGGRGILVHTEPVDKPGQPVDDRRRGRRGGRSGGNGGSGGSSGHGSGGSSGSGGAGGRGGDSGPSTSTDGHSGSTGPAQATPSGPTPAQIAAAAYAALHPERRSADGESAPASTPAQEAHAGRDLVPAHATSTDLMTVPDEAPRTGRVNGRAAAQEADEASVRADETDAPASASRAPASPAPDSRASASPSSDAPGSAQDDDATGDPLADAAAPTRRGRRRRARATAPAGPPPSSREGEEEPDSPSDPGSGASDGSDPEA